MIDLRPALRAILLADPSVSAMVGGSRIYPTVLPQGMKSPSIVQNLVTENIDYYVAGDVRLMMARVQLDHWSQTSDLSAQLAGLVFDRLTGYKVDDLAFGSNSPQSRITIKGIFHDQGSDNYENEALMYSRRRDYLVWYWVR